MSSKSLSWRNVLSELNHSQKIICLKIFLTSRPVPKNAWPAGNNNFSKFWSIIKCWQEISVFTSCSCTYISFRYYMISQNEPFGKGRWKRTNVMQGHKGRKIPNCQKCFLKCFFGHFKKCFYLEKCFLKCSKKCFK